MSQDSWLLNHKHDDYCLNLIFNSSYARERVEAGLNRWIKPLTVQILDSKEPQ